MSKEIAAVKEQEVKHTPTPWELHAAVESIRLIAPWSSSVRAADTPTFGDYQGALIAEFPFVRTDGAVPTEAQARANAEHVLRAVDAHDALVEALSTSLCPICKYSIGFRPQLTKVSAEWPNCDGCRDTRAMLAAVQE